MALPAPSALAALVLVVGPAWTCLLCFTTHDDRLQVCQTFAGIEGPKLQECRKALVIAFKGLTEANIYYDERSHLHDLFTQTVHSLQETAEANKSFKDAFTDAAEKMKEEITQLKEAQPCVPPCGLQEFSRLFRCRGCYSTVCDLPLDCPVKDVTVAQGDQALFSCAVNFQLPEEEVAYSWKFAEGGLRTQDQSHFRELRGARGNLARIRPAQAKHQGTFSCEIKHDQRLLARLYFFLNVTRPPPRKEGALQVSFREVLNWTDKEGDVVEPWRPSLGELLAQPGALTPSNQFLLALAAAFLSASLTLLGWMLFRWYVSTS
ncbi:sperm acrosome membrane-associated protein 6 isoform X14 [Choloepus didactylus]|uniref:sperm acrosome membrane-associated protein 6 isoform X14 n=1 Tax=Choloepus didactylus TaxID=27675 RepID=UPI0018A0953C|nr:sperm acrosome membrane-associated protein 6 isoform X14 [Choloepus didactylus]